MAEINLRFENKEGSTSCMIDKDTSVNLRNDIILKNAVRFNGFPLIPLPESGTITKVLASENLYKKEAKNVIIVKTLNDSLIEQQKTQFEFVYPIDAFQMDVVNINIDNTDCNPFLKDNEKGGTYDGPIDKLYFLTMYKKENMPSIEESKKDQLNSKVLENVIIVAKFLKSKRISYPDFNPQNILIDVNSKLYLIDFADIRDSDSDYDESLILKSLKNIFERVANKVNRKCKVNTVQSIENYESQINTIFSSTKRPSPPGFSPQPSRLERFINSVESPPPDFKFGTPPRGKGLFDTP